jgi:hypothetical protein
MQATGPNAILGNFTGDYNDHLDGDFLACKPGATADGLEFLCTIGFPAVGTALLLTGASFLYFAADKLSRGVQSIDQQTRTTAAEPGVESSHTTHAKMHFYHIVKLLATLGINAVLLGLISIVYGWGTIYPTTHVRGQVGDVLRSIQVFTYCLLNVLQQRGAKNFKAIIPVPQQGRHATTAGFKWTALRPLSGKIGSCLLLCMCLGLWGLLYGEVITRGWFHFIIVFIQLFAGMRTAASMISMRLVTLRRVAAIARAQDGEREVKLRRQGFLRGKTFWLAVDLFGMFLFAIFWPLFMLFSGATFNSRQFAICTLVAYGQYAVIAMLSAMHVRKKFRKVKRKIALTKEASRTTGEAGGISGPSGFRSIASSIPSGMSAITESDV